MTPKELKHAEEMAKAKARKAAENARRKRVKAEHATLRRMSLPKMAEEERRLRKERRLKQLRRKLKLKDPQVGVKPPTPIAPPPIAPGSGTDDWREQE